MKPDLGSRDQWAARQCGHGLGFYYKTQLRARVVGFGMVGWKDELSPLKLGGHGYGCGWASMHVASQYIFLRKELTLNWKILF